MEEEGTIWKVGIKGRVEDEGGRKQVMDGEWTSRSAKYCFTLTRMISWLLASSGGFIVSNATILRGISYEYLVGHV